MSTSNFTTMDDFPLVCGGMFSDYARTYYGEDYDFDSIDDDVVYDEIEFDELEFNKMASQFSDDLRYYDVSVADGYYDGWQFIVEPKDGFDTDFFHKDSKWCIDNDSAHYWFDKCKSTVLREAESERKKINKWLDLQSKKELTHKLQCVGIFSNGEAVYREA